MMMMIRLLFLSLLLLANASFKPSFASAKGIAAKEAAAPNYFAEKIASAASHTQRHLDDLGDFDFISLVCNALTQSDPDELDLGIDLSCTCTDTSISCDIGQFCEPQCSPEGDTCCATGSFSFDSEGSMESCVDFVTGPYEDVCYRGKFPTTLDDPAALDFECEIEIRNEKCNECKSCTGTYGPGYVIDCKNLDKEWFESYGCETETSAGSVGNGTSGLAEMGIPFVAFERSEGGDATMSSSFGVKAVTPVVFISALAGSLAIHFM